MPHFLTRAMVAIKRSVCSAIFEVSIAHSVRLQRQLFTVQYSTVHNHWGQESYVLSTSLLQYGIHGYDRHPSSVPQLSGLQAPADRPLQACKVEGP